MGKNLPMRSPIGTKNFSRGVRQMDKKTRLQKALESKEKLRIIYRGGSQPGTVREIEVEKLGREKMRALCHQSGVTKTFIIDRVSVIEDDVPVEALPWRNEQGAQPVTCVTVQELYAEIAEYLLNLGWHVNCEDHRLSLHRRFKNGKPLKGADVELTYQEYTSKMVFDFETGEDIEVDKKPRERPWTVRMKNATTRTYGELAGAAGTFLEMAQKIAPNEQNA
jgi:hypothetical protein